MNASIRTAAAVPIPTSLRNTTFDVANAPIATARRIAAEVTRRPVRWSPIATASRSPPPFSRDSLMRARRKTP